MKHKYSLDFVSNEVSQGVRITAVVFVQRYVEVNFSVEWHDRYSCVISVEADAAAEHWREKLWIQLIIGLFFELKEKSNWGSYLAF